MTLPPTVNITIDTQHVAAPKPIMTAASCGHCTTRRSQLSGICFYKRTSQLRTGRSAIRSRWS